MFIAGLTGNYGMGKSAVLQMFRELGAVTIDADWVVQQLLREKQVHKKIKTLLGAGVFDKKALSTRVKSLKGFSGINHCGLSLKTFFIH